MLRNFAALVAAMVVMSLAGCGYNDLQRLDEGIKAAWSEVVNQYQRRADLVPNLVNTVKGYAAQEADVLTAVTNARANVSAIKATPGSSTTLRHLEFRPRRASSRARCRGCWWWPKTIRT